MKKEDVLNLMTELPPDLIEEADLQAPARRRLPRLARAGLIAACLCLVLIGTAAAVHFSGLSIVEGDNDVTYLQGGIAYVPYDSLSREIRTIIEEAGGHAAVQRAASWQAAEDLIGIDLLNNPVLDASPARTFFTKRGGVSGRFHVEPSKEKIHICGCFEIGGVNIEVESYLFTEYGQAQVENWDGTFLGLWFSDDSEVSLDSYTAPSSLTAQIIEAYTPSSNTNHCVGTVSLHGIPAIVWCQSTASMEEARAALYQILDGFLLD